MANNKRRPSPPGGSARAASAAPRPVRVVPTQIAVTDSPAFQKLVRERSRFAWALSLIMVAVYAAFILLVAFAHDLMATKVIGDEISLGILLGFGTIVLAVVLTGFYVSRANTRFDELTRQIVGDRR